MVVQGGGRLGTHDVGTVAVHYTDAWSAYGPIVAADDGISWFTLRNAWDSGARYMPAARDQLRVARQQNFQHREATAHVECRKDAEVIDESPAAYKSIDAVMEAQRDLVEVVHTLKQVVCVKG